MADIIPVSLIALVASGTVDLDSDTMVATLHTSGAAFTYASENYVSTYELPTGSGYTQLNEAITGQAVAHSGLYTTFDIADVSWTAAGGDIGPARYCALVDTQGAMNKYVYIMDFVSDKTANDATDFKIVVNSSGLFKMYQG